MGKSKRCTKKTPPPPLHARTHTHHIKTIMTTQTNTRTHKTQFDYLMARAMEK